MPKIKWDKKDFITKLLVEKYGVLEKNVMKKKFRHQLIAAMAPDEIKAEIKILSNNTHDNYLLEIKDLRHQFVAKFIRRVHCTGEFYTVKLQLS